MTSSRRRLLLGTAVLLIGPALVGCGQEQSSEEPGAEQAQTQEADLRAEHGYDNASAEEIIDELDQARPGDKPKDLFASVRPDQLVLQDPKKPEMEQSVPIERGFYLAVAPYVEGTHECFHHSLTTCQGELVGEDLDVTITERGGKVLVDETVTTYPNGFVGFWLPRDVEATLEVRYDGRSAETEIATGAKDPTCLTTVQLT
jgi:hypothetical protein